MKRVARDRRAFGKKTWTDAYHAMDSTLGPAWAYQKFNETRIDSNDAECKFMNSVWFAIVAQSGQHT